MRFKAYIATILLTFSATTAAMAASQPLALVQVPNVAALTINASTDYSATPQLRIGGYATTGDGGAASYSLIAGGCGAELPGACVHDSAGNAYKRVDWSPSLGPFGIVNGGAYDYYSNKNSPTDATPRIAAALTAMQAVGIYTASTGGVSVYIGTTLTLGNYEGLDCGVDAIGPYSTGHYDNRPGSLIEKHGFNVHASGSIDQQSLTGCVIIPEWYTNPTGPILAAFGGYTFNYPIQNYGDLEAIRGNMIAAGDTGVYFDASRGGKLINLGVYCFDTGIQTNAPNEATLATIKTDSNVGVYTSNGGSSTVWENLHSQNYCTKQVEDLGGQRILVSSNWSVLAINPSTNTNTFGTHLCSITVGNGVDTNGNPLLATQIKNSALNAQGTANTYPVWLANLVTSLGAGNGVACKGYGPFAIANIAYSAGNTVATFDLLNSDYGTGADAIVTSATWKVGNSTTCMPQPCTVIYITSGDANAIQPGETVTGTGIPVGTKVLAQLPGELGDDPYDGYIAAFLLDKAATAAGNDGTLTFDGGTYSSLGNCGSIKEAACLFIDVSQRVYAGTSAGGVFTSLLPQSDSLRYAAAYACNNTVGLRGSKNQSFSHHYNYAVYACNGISQVQQGSDDSNKIQDDFSTTGIYLTGNINKATYQGGLTGTGVGMIADMALVGQNSGHATTVTAGSGTGLTTLTTAGSMSSWNKDANGHMTVALCAALDSGTCLQDDPGTEFVTTDVTGSTAIKLIARGRFETVPLSVTTGWHVVEASISSKVSNVNIYAAGLNTIGANTADFMWLHGAVNLSSTIARGVGQIGFISNNFINSVFTGNQFADMTIYYDGLAGYSTSRGCGNSWAIAYAWECFGADPSVTITTSGNLDLTSHDIFCDATSGVVILTVPTGSTSSNWFYNITKVDNSTNLCKINASGSDTIGGVTSTALALFNDHKRFKNDNGGTDWVIQ